jgi:hypothetical protein
MPFSDFEKWVDFVRAFLNTLPPRSGPRKEYLLYYVESDYVCTWPYVPTNLTHFAVDDYHPSWM